MLTTATHLRDQLLELDNDLGGLPGRRVALLGFRDPNPKRVDDNLRALRDASGWAVVDLRDAPSVPLPAALTETIAAPKLVLILNVASALPRDAAMLIRALHDSRDSVDWSDGTDSELPEDRMLYVVAAGARSVEELPPLLQRIDFMTFIRPRE